MNGEEKEEMEFYEKYWQKRVEEHGRGFSVVAKIRSEIVLKLLLDVGLAGRVLDIGCGDGTMLSFLKNYFAFEAFGIDISKSAIELAREKGINAQLVDVTKKLPFPNDFFDAAICSEVLEHVIIPQRTLYEIKRVTKKNAIVIFSVPNTGFFKCRFKLLIGESPFEQGRYSSNEHLHFWTQKSFVAFLRSNGFEIVRILGTKGKLSSVFPSLFSDTLFVKTRMCL